MMCACGANIFNWTHKYFLQDDVYGHFWLFSLHNLKLDNTVSNTYITLFARLVSFKNRLFVFLYTENVLENIFCILSSIIHQDVISSFFIFNYKLEEHMQ